MDYTYQPVADPEAPTLSADGKLSIANPEGATEFDIYANTGTTAETNKKVGTVKAQETTTIVDLNGLITEAGQYTISVVAKAPNKADSDAVAATGTYTVLAKLATPKTSWSTEVSNLMMIETVTGAENYIITVGNKTTTVAASTLEFNVAEFATAQGLAAGQYNVTVVATGANYQDSAASAALTYTVPAAG
jgi:hypothetical protein